MRDLRYVKSLAETGPSWAHGCENCEYGLAIAPIILAAFPLNEGRAVQASEGMITFCNCKAGHLYRQHLRRVYNGLSMETVRSVLEHIAAVSVPTIHYEPPPTPEKEATL